MLRVPVGVSARHIHLCTAHVKALFGAHEELHALRPLRQPGQFATHETVKVIGPRGEFAKVRILGPARSLSQLEISRTDAVALGIDAPVRMSGEVTGTPGIRIVGPQGEVALHEGVIVAARHIHLSPADALAWHVSQHQSVCVRLGVGERALTLENVVIRIHETFVCEMHIDTDEANAAGVQTGDVGTVVMV